MQWLVDEVAKLGGLTLECMSDVEASFTKGAGRLMGHRGGGGGPREPCKEQMLQP